MDAIKTSLFELFKIGPGPSSSHTIGPMKAGYDFIKTIRELPVDTENKPVKLDVRLYGSLSATGKGHGTDRAILAGLLGQEPATCPSDLLDRLLVDPSAQYDIDIGKTKLPMTEKDIIFDQVEHHFPYSNTVVIRLIGEKATIFEREYYSTGGGFIQWKGWEQPERGEPIYPYRFMSDIRRILSEKHLELHELMLANEKAITGMKDTEIHEGLDMIVDAMEESIERGIKAQGVLPGAIGLHKKASTLFDKAHKEHHIADRFLILLSAYAIAAAEENASGHRIVTAPTAGSAGVIPAVLYCMKHHLHIPIHAIRESLLAAAAVGFLAKNNASIAGAEVGCQGEIGVASSMAAAMLAHANKYNSKIAEDAAEIALEHHLGLTCDPVGGYVQIPCIERNAMGAVKAYNAYLIASDEIPDWHIIDLDKAIWVMGETGKDMCFKYKETSQGGLALCAITC